MDKTHYEDMLRRAYFEATASPDPSTQNGAIVLDNNGVIIGAGCNTFTKGVTVTSDLLERPKKYAFIEHAERSALFMAATLWTQGGHKPHTLAAAWASCADCARAIVGMGVKVLVRHVREDDEGRWNESIEWGDQILKAAGVEIVDVHANLGCAPVLFNGKLMNP